MIFKECTIGFMLPFEYEESCYDLTALEKNAELQEHFTEKRITAQWLNPIGEAMLTDDESRIVKCYEFKTGLRRKIGLARRNTPVYELVKGDFRCRFGIDNIRVWFWKRGKAFFTIQISARNLNENELLDLKKFLTDVKAKAKIEYRQKDAPDHEEVKKFTVRELIEGKKDGSEGLFSLIRSFQPKIQKKRAFHTFGKAYSITYGVAESLKDDTLPVFLENLRLDAGSKCRGEAEIPDDRHYINKGFKLHWAFSGNSMIMLGDWENEFLRGTGNLHYSVFHSYMMLYQYYLYLYIECMEAKACYDLAKRGIGKNRKEMIHLWMQFDNSLDELTDQEHINCIFLEYLCKNVWKLQESVRDVHDEYLPYLIKNSDYNVFISYRRDGGFYLARLLYELLEKNGKTPFLDVERLTAGKFDKQIYSVIDRCENVVVILSPNSLDHCTNLEEEDWFRNEIVYSIKNKKTIIPVLMENFEYPKQLPEEMKDFPMHNGILSLPQYFSNVVESINKFLK